MRGGGGPRRARRAERGAAGRLGSIRARAPRGRATRATRATRGPRPRGGTWTRRRSIRERPRPPPRRARGTAPPSSWRYRFAPAERRLQKIKSGARPSRRPERYATPRSTRADAAAVRLSHASVRASRGLALAPRGVRAGEVSAEAARSSLCHPQEDVARDGTHRGTQRPSGQTSPPLIPSASSHGTLEKLFLDWLVV